MKTYSELSADQQKRALEKCIEELLNAICDGAMRFNDELNQDDLQARIDKAITKANAMHTPWFASSYIMDLCREDIEGMALTDAEDAIYAEKNERIIYGVL